MIFDPKLERAFCKDFMVGLNTRSDLFPEYPMIDGMRMKKKGVDVFENYIVDGKEQIENTFKIDSSISNNF